MTKINSELGAALKTQWSTLVDEHKLLMDCREQFSNGTNRYSSCLDVIEKVHADAGAEVFGDYDVAKNTVAEIIAFRALLQPAKGEDERAAFRKDAASKIKNINGVRLQLGMQNNSETKSADELKSLVSAVSSSSSSSSRP